MAALRTHHPLRDHRETAATVADALWVLALGVIVAYVFFAALGAFAPGDVLAVTIGVVALSALWLVHGWSSSRRSDHGRDPRLTSARERRGF